MFAVDPGSARRFVEGFWNAHVLDWSTLEISRHGEYGLEAGPLWEHTFADPEPFPFAEGYFGGDGETVLFDSLEPWALLALEAARRPAAGEFPRYAGGAGSTHAGAYYVV